MSTHITAASATTRDLQCSSSTTASSLGGKELGGDDVGEGQNRAAPDLMVYDTGTTPIMSPNPAFNHKEWQQGVADLQQPVSGEPQPRGELTKRSSTKTFTSSLGLIPSGEANFCWGKSKDVVPPHWSSGLSAIEPGLTANTTTARSVGCLGGCEG